MPVQVYQVVCEICKKENVFTKREFYCKTCHRGYIIINVSTSWKFWKKEQRFACPICRKSDNRYTMWKCRFCNHILKYDNLD